jgi:hypothetical protein
MFQKIVPITKEAHQSKKIKPIVSYAFAKDIHMVSVMMHEFTRVAPIYPIVFLEDQEADEFRPMALLGLEPKQNLFVNAEGVWEASYIPAIIRRYPFALARTDKEDQFTVCIDEDSEYVSDTDGQPMFLENDEISPVLEQAKQYLLSLQQMEMATKQFSRALKDKYMFTPLNMHIREENTVKNLTGAYAVYEERLNTLSEKAGTIVWNGPVGVFEFDQFGNGTKALAEAIAESSAFSIAGGGDTLAAVDKYGVKDKISYISTGGGAFLEFLEGKQLPAVAMLEERGKK